MRDAHKSPYHDTGQSIVSVGTTNNNSVVLDCVDGNNEDINCRRKYVLVVYGGSKWSIKNYLRAHQCDSARSKHISTDHVYVPCRALHGAIQQKRQTGGTVLSRLGYSYYFQCFQPRKKKLNLFSSPKVREMLRLLLVSVVTHHSHYSPHWIILRVTMAIYNLLSSCKMLSPTLSCSSAWSRSIIFCLLTTQVPTFTTKKLQVKQEYLKNLQCFSYLSCRFLDHWSVLPWSSYFLWGGTCVQV